MSTTALATTQQMLRASSDGTRESLVLWAGRTVRDGVAVVSHVLEPQCMAQQDFLVVPHGERAEVSRYLRAAELLIFADLHTHPRDAFLSVADQARPFSVRLGFYAIVVPDFGTRRPLDGWRMYEAKYRGWGEVDVGDRLRMGAL